jgi:hypothetical protein
VVDETSITANKQNQTTMKNKLIQYLVIVLVVIIPIVSFGQPSGPGPGSEAVPFDDNMNLLFLVSGIAFALMITIKQLQKKQVAGK